MARRIVRWLWRRHASTPSTTTALRARQSGVVLGNENRLDGVRLAGRARDHALINVGDQCDLEGTWLLNEPEATITIGSRSELNHGCSLDVLERLEIGDDVLIGPEVHITDHDSHALDWELRRNDHLARRTGSRDYDVVERAPVRIGDKVWIGRRALILRGVTIGEGAVVAAGSIVTRDVAPWTLVAGVPAREVRKLPAYGAPSET